MDVDEDARPPSSAPARLAEEALESESRLRLMAENRQARKEIEADVSNGKGSAAPGPSRCWRGPLSRAAAGNASSIVACTDPTPCTAPDGRHQIGGRGRRSTRSSARRGFGISRTIASRVRRGPRLRAHDTARSNMALRARRMGSTDFLVCPSITCSSCRCRGACSNRSRARCEQLVRAPGEPVWTGTCILRTASSGSLSEGGRSAAHDHDGRDARTRCTRRSAVASQHFVIARRPGLSDSTSWSSGDPLSALCQQQA